MNSPPNPLLAVVTLVCHTVVLVAIIVAVAVLANDKTLSSDTLGLLGAIGGITGSGLVVNGRKINGQST